MVRNLQQIKENLSKWTQSELEKMVQENINNKDKLIGIHFKNRQRTTSLENKEKEIERSRRKNIRTDNHG
ncbi:hypothetical protein EII29_06295 [Leptotrichia sp. OH3620_COT-345]|uniref:hypothetical protein n=1 Tax=Leptotrichia sp. OH3620_COT-345 TaxID=2491048 RepID=UPI000F64C973|nr:hypothetical protein [Leptotrichia sp. OH3620_COT-345]RRD39645.1 hypothetical protein EII29_06295 [Leptotrichia sp. OH3620_COT-345]